MIWCLVAIADEAGRLRLICWCSQLHMYAWEVLDIFVPALQVLDVHVFALENLEACVPPGEFLDVHVLALEILEVCLPAGEVLDIGTTTQKAPEITSTSWTETADQL